MSEQQNVWLAKMLGVKMSGCQYVWVVKGPGVKMLYQMSGCQNVECSDVGESAEAPCGPGWVSPPVMDKYDKV